MPSIQQQKTTTIQTTTWYSPNQALFFGILFTILDISINIFGLAWNGRFFTFNNIKHWFDFRYYHFTINPIDFLVIFL